MIDLATVVFLGLFCFVCFMSLAVFVGGAFFYIRWRLKDNRATIAQVGEAFGLVDKAHERAFPELHGIVNGVDVVVDVVYQKYARAGTSMKQSLRAWTRVRAMLPAKSQIIVRSRDQRLDEKLLDSQLPVRQTGDPAFDHKFELFAPHDFDLDHFLPHALRLALLNANPSVHILSDSVCWMKVKYISEVELLKRAVNSCVSVASCAPAN